ncbi:MAG: GGDEF domain-containing protein [Chloroflexi bacterium]|nr:GGDEF domain-containing protein [Chloroflexota bacterium]
MYNRAFFEEKIIKLEANRIDPITIIILDLNYLKRTNDTLGHQAGDRLIRRVAEVLNAAFNPHHVCARMGGDEFAVILKSTDRSDAADYIKQIDALIEVNNKYYREPELSISIGFATSSYGVSLEKVVGFADDAMYRNKSEHHRRRKDDTTT